MKGTDESSGRIPVEGHVANALPSPMDKTCKLMPIIFSQKYFFNVFMIFNFLQNVNIILKNLRSFVSKVRLLNALLGNSLQSARFFIFEISLFILFKIISDPGPRRTAKTNPPSKKPSFCHWLM